MLRLETVSAMDSINDIISWPMETKVVVHTLRDYYYPLGEYFSDYNFVSYSKLRSDTNHMGFYPRLDSKTIFLCSDVWYVGCLG